MKRLMTYKVAALFFATTTVFALWAPWQDQPSGFPNEANGVAPHGQVDLMRQLRIPAGKLGIDEEDLFASLRRADSAAQAVAIMKKIGHVASERALPLLEKFAHDPRREVAAAAVHAIGHIGGEHATDLLLSLETSERRLTDVVVAALGATGSERGVERLFVLARDARSQSRGAAIHALGEADVGGTTALFREILPGAQASIVTVIVRSLASLSDPEAQEMLRGLLVSDRVTVRVAAINAFEIKDDEGAAMLMESLASADTETAEAAARALGRSRRSIAVSLLLQTAQDAPAPVRGASISALGKIGGDDARDALGQALRGGNSQLSREAAWALVDGHDPKSIAVLVDVAKNGSGAGRSMALRALESVGGKQADEVMLAALNGGRADAQRSALHYLVRSNHPEGVQKALEIAQHGPRRQRMDAINALSQNDSSAAQSGLKELARNTTGAVRNQALAILARRAPDDTEVVDLLVESMESGRPQDAYTVASSLATAGTPAARDALIAALSKGGSQSASAAASALGRMGGPEAMLALTDAARNGKKGVKQQALQQLISSGEPSALTIAKEALQGDDANAASGIIWSLANVGSEESQALLRDAAGNKAGSVRAAAASALAQNGDAGSMDLLAGLASDKDRNVRYSALSSIAQIGGERATQIIIAAAEHGDAKARVEAIAHLGRLDDERATKKLCEAVGDDSPEVALAAIYAAGPLGAKGEDALLARVLDAGAPAHVRQAAARVLQQNGSKLAEQNKAALAALMGTSAADVSRGGEYYLGGPY